jgi:hypothetical protein
MAKRKNPHETKTHNYLLRSVHRDNLLDIMILVLAGRVRPDGFGYPAIFKADGTWAGHCSWGVETLEKRNLADKITYMDGKSHYELTRLGHSLLLGALTALGRHLDMDTVLDRIDTTRVY